MATSPQAVRPLLQKVAVITGASRGIGLAIAETFAAAGCELALCARNTKFIDATGLADCHGIRVLVRECDVRKEQAVVDLFEDVRGHFGGIDYLINNAGTATPMTRVDQVALDDWREAIDTNLTGTFLCTRAALPLLRRGGAIVNNLSVAAKGVFAGESPYIAAKHGAKGFTDTLREELRERAIRVVGLFPGATDTDLWNVFWPDAPRERMMSPATVARAVLNLLTLPENATVEELVLAPTSGAL